MKCKLTLYCVFLKYKARNFNSDVMVVCCGSEMYKYLSMHL